MSLVEPPGTRRRRPSRRKITLSGGRGRGGVVGDHHDRLAVPRLVSRRRLSTSAPARVSRLPVGSSASSNSGASRSERTSTRVAARRSTSLPGGARRPASPTRSSSSRARRSSFVAAAPGDQRRQVDVLHRAERGQQLEELEDRSRCGTADLAARARRGPRTCRPPTATVPSLASRACPGCGARALALIRTGPSRLRIAGLNQEIDAVERAPGRARAEHLHETVGLNRQIGSAVHHANGRPRSARDIPARYPTDGA